MLVNDLAVPNREAGSMVIRQEITDEQWAVLAPLFPAPKGRDRPPRDICKTVESINWRFSTGAPWRDVRDRFGHWNSIYQRFSHPASPSRTMEGAMASIVG